MVRAHRARRNKTAQHREKTRHMKHTVRCTEIENKRRITRKKRTFPTKTHLTTARKKKPTVSCEQHRLRPSRLVN